MIKKNPSLSLCILLDMIGMSSYLLPFLGEVTDVIWAPFSAILFFFLFGRKRFGFRGAVFSFIEEILPGFDFIPTFTIAHFVRRAETSTKVQQLINLK